MRRLIKGRLLAQINDDFERIDPGHAWFETGKDPVIGTNVHTGNSAFVRVMLLPIELQCGKSSFVPTTAEDAGKPRAVMQRLFGEVVVEAVHVFPSSSLAAKWSGPPSGIIAPTATVGWLYSRSMM